MEKQILHLQVYADNAFRDSDAEQAVFRKSINDDSIDAAVNAASGVNIK